jgi:archaetidylinositol phosphate synthase
MISVAGVSRWQNKNRGKMPRCASAPRRLLHRLIEMSEIEHSTLARQRPWDARRARRLVAPLNDSSVTPNNLTTARLRCGVAAAATFTAGNCVCSNRATSLLAVLSNLVDHTDRELARMHGKTSRFGHLHDLASDAAITILLFIAIAIAIASGVDATPHVALQFPPAVLGAAAGCAIALIFFLRMRIEEMIGKATTQQASRARCPKIVRI